MNQAQKEKLLTALFDFVERIAKESRTATPAEVEALPKVAELLLCAGHLLDR